MYNFETSTYLRYILINCCNPVNSFISLSTQNVMKTMESSKKIRNVFYREHIRNMTLVWTPFAVSEQHWHSLKTIVLYLNINTKGDHISAQVVSVLGGWDEGSCFCNNAEIMLIPIKHLFTVEIRQFITQQFSTPTSSYYLTENWVLVFLDFKASIWWGRWKFSWLLDVIQFLLEQ